MASGSSMQRRKVARFWARGQVKPTEGLLDKVRMRCETRAPEASRAMMSRSDRPMPTPGSRPAGLVIHVGMQKTGTTFLQQALRDNHVALSAVGLQHLDPGAGLGQDFGAAHHFLAHALLGRRLRHTPAIGFDRLGDHVEALHAALNGAPDGGCAVLSSEDFSLFKRVHIQRLRALFPDCAPGGVSARRVRVLVYLRRQDLWLDSLYGHMLKIGRRQDIATFVDRNRWRLNYEAILAPWVEVFGAENLILRTYESFGETSDRDAGLWADFCAALDCPQAASVLPRQARANVSLPPEAGRFLNGVRDARRRERLRRILERSLSQSRRGPGLVWLPATQAASIMAEQAERNRRIAQRHLGRDRLFLDEDIRVLPPARSGWRAQVLIGRLLTTGLVLRLMDWLRGD